MLVELVRVNGASQRRELRDLVADNEQLQVVEAAMSQHVVRLDEPDEVLVRLDIADIQHEALCKLVAFADACHILLRRRAHGNVRQSRYRRRRSSSGGTLKKWMMSRLDASETVRIRCDRRTAIHIDAARTRRPPGVGRYCGNIRWMQS